MSGRHVLPTDLGTTRRLDVLSAPSPLLPYRYRVQALLEKRAVSASHPSQGSVPVNSYVEDVLTLATAKTPRLDQGYAIYEAGGRYRYGPRFLFDPAAPSCSMLGKYNVAEQLLLIVGRQEVIIENPPPPSPIIFNRKSLPHLNLLLSQIKVLH
ncbi:hypothetical protein LZ554_007053 [Drepanopeziza brunnea f. sp. 'monogermtubi']|nr:hypothetical protein LZ554_007053 [Drepanopeziza brunnea f. sp. 'monogermtubi']